MYPSEQLEVAKIVIQTVENVSGDYFAVIALIATIILAIIGWGISIWLQQKNHKQEQQAKINYDIYSQLVTAHKELQDAIASFNASTHAPLILMSTELIPLEIKQQLGEQSILPYVSEEECLHKGSVKYSKWLYDQMFFKGSKYSDKLSTFMYLTEDWAAPLASTRTALVALRSELSRLNSIMTINKQALQNYSRTHDDDWRKWDEDDLRGLGNAISDAVMSVSHYISDYMVLAHNELLAPYYGYKRLVRKTYDDSFRVLTKEGLVTRIEDDPEIRATVAEIIKQNKSL